MTVQVEVLKVFQRRNMTKETVKIVVARDLDKGVEVTIDVPKENITEEVSEILKQQQNSLAERIKKSNQVRNKWEKK